MAFRLYNTLTRAPQEFTPLAPPAVTMYVCGPTVYDEPHIGHARSAFAFDVLRRYLAFKGYQVRFVRNVTDVDDKIIEKARQELAHSTQHTAHSDLKEKCREVAERYLKSYHEAMGRLGLGRPDLEPKATEHVVPDMTDFITKLLINGVAYEAGGDVYCAVRKCEGYGALSGRSLDALQAGARVEPGEQKHDPLDFALWKAAKPGEPSWQSPWGAGRPGWHIECSTMSTKYLGDAFDIHGGGVDLVFPHHENEIAQAHAAGKPFAKHWIHNGLLTVNGEKMSKSLRNFMTVEEALAACGGEPDVLKMFFLSASYRSPLDYTASNLTAAGQRFDSLVSFLIRVLDVEQLGSAQGSEPGKVTTLKRQFVDAMDDDLNTPKALAVLDQLATYGHQCLEGFERRPLAQSEQQAWDGLTQHVASAANAIETLGATLGLRFGRTPVTEMVEVLVREREEARKRDDFSTADQKRQLVEAQGYIIEDTRHGPIVRRKR